MASYIGSCVRVFGHTPASPCANNQRDTSKHSASYKFELRGHDKTGSAPFVDWIADISEKFIKHAGFIDYIPARIKWRARAFQLLKFERDKGLFELPIPIV